MIYTMRHYDRGEKFSEGTLPELSAKYRAFCEANTGLRHGPATLRLDGNEVGFINAKGQAWLKQPSHILAFDPDAQSPQDIEVPHD